MSPHNFKDKSPLMAIDRSTKFQSIKIFFHWWKAWSYLLFDSKNILDNRTKSKQKHKEKKTKDFNSYLEAVVVMASTASKILWSAESAPMVISVPQKSLSIEPT